LINDEGNIVMDAIEHYVFEPIFRLYFIYFIIGIQKKFPIFEGNDWMVKGLKNSFFFFLIHINLAAKKFVVFAN